MQDNKDNSGEVSPEKSAQTNNEAEGKATQPAQQAGDSTAKHRHNDRRKGHNRGKDDERAMRQKQSTNQEVNANNAPQADKTATNPVDDEEDYIATAEEVAAEARRSAERRMKKHAEGVKSGNESEFEEYVSPDSLIDPYLDPDPDIPWPKSNESVFLSRGCLRCPDCEKGVSGAECRSCSKAGSCNWLEGVKMLDDGENNIVEVRFKNNRREFFRLADGVNVSDGDVVVVDAQPGHDVGIVSLTGYVCRLQMAKYPALSNVENMKRVLRKARTVDVEKWAECLGEEHAAMIRTRQIAEDLGLVMKIDDVEIQGDHSKAIFYYTADDRVDFRSLIKLLAEEFHMRIEMRQIGVRQESGRLGGLGTCGRELCCSTWLSSFKTVTTSAAKAQQIHPNPQKLAGQCGKLKCCLNFEYEVYADALKQFPPAGTAIRFKKGLAMYKKTDVLRGIMWYAYEGDNDLHAIPAEKVKQVIEMNNRQEYPEQLEDFQVQFASTTALQQEGNNAEFEQELQRLASKEQTAADSGSKSSQRGDERRGSKQQGRGGGDHKQQPKGGDQSQRRSGNNDHRESHGGEGRSRRSSDRGDKRGR